MTETVLLGLLAGVTVIVVPSNLAKGTYRRFFRKGVIVFFLLVRIFGGSRWSGARSFGFGFDLRRLSRGFGLRNTTRLFLTLTMMTRTQQNQLRYD